jgi:hypothetical protein
LRNGPGATAIRAQASLINAKPPRLLPRGFGRNLGCACKGRSVCAGNHSMLAGAGRPTPRDDGAKTIRFRSSRNDSRCRPAVRSSSGMVWSATLTILCECFAAAQRTGIATQGRSRFVLDSVRYRHMRRRRHVCAHNNDRR